MGTIIIAALTVSSRIVAIAYMIMIGWGQGFQPICAIDYGAKRYDRLDRHLKLTVVIGTGFWLFQQLSYIFFRIFNYIDVKGQVKLFL